MALEVDHLQLCYRTLRGDVRAVDDVTFTIDDGEIMGLAGESGCGKSTLGNGLVRMDVRMRQLAGRVELDGEELPISDEKAMRSFRFKSVSIVPQYAMSSEGLSNVEMTITTRCFIPPESSIGYRFKTSASSPTSLTRRSSSGSADL